MGRKKVLCYSKVFRHRLYTTNLYTRDFAVLLPLYNNAVYTAKNCQCSLQGCLKYRKSNFGIPANSKQDFLNHYQPPEPEIA